MVDDVYARLGVQRVVNAAGNFTDLGGSVPAAETLSAMGVTARDFVEIRDLQRAVHRRLAELTKNEAAYVTSGAAAGLYLATAAAVSALHNKSIERLNWDDIHACEVVIHRGCRNPYDRAVEQVGVSLVEVGYPNALVGTCLDELASAIGPTHCCSAACTRRMELSGHSHPGRRCGSSQRCRCSGTCRRVSANSAYRESVANDRDWRRCRDFQRR